MKINELANTGREIIGDMYRWGVLDEHHDYDVTEMDDAEIISIIVQLFRWGYIHTETHEDILGFYVPVELILKFQGALIDSLLLEEDNNES